MFFNYFFNYSANASFTNTFKKYKKAKPNSKSILMYVGIGKMFLTPFEILLYHLFKKEGFQVKYLIYDHRIPINELATLERYKKYGDSLYKKNSSNAVKILKKANVDYDFINSVNPVVEDLIHEIPLEIASLLDYKYDNINFGFIVRNNLNRYYRSTDTSKYMSDVAMKYLKTSLLNYFEVKKRCSQKKYDYILFSHGINVTWGPIKTFCENNEIKYFSYDRAKTEGKINFNYNKPAPIWDITDFWNKNIDRSLNKDEQRILNDYVKDRELQKNDTFRYNSNKKETNFNQLKNNLGIPHKSKIITIFTNLIWDATAVSKSAIFNDFTECILETINFLRNKKNIHILVRSHPAEKVLNSNEYYKDLILDKLGSAIPANLSFTPNDTSINSFSIIDLTDIAIVNTSTIGIECAISNKPVIAPFECHYGNKGFTYDPKTIQSFFQIIQSNLDSSKTLQNQSALAKKYFYLMMFKYQKTTPIIFKNNFFRKYTFNNLDELSKNDQVYDIVLKIKEHNLSELLIW